MAEAPAAGQAPPTFKLVLVGDGGTGKVGSSNTRDSPSCLLHQRQCGRFHLGRCICEISSATDESSLLDNIREASLDGRIREEIHRHLGCGSTSAGIHDGSCSIAAGLITSLVTGSYSDRGIELGPDSVRCMGHCGPREVWWFERWILYQRSMWYHHVRCDVADHLQERAQLAS